MTAKDARQMEANQRELDRQEAQRIQNEKNERIAGLRAEMLSEVPKYRAKVDERIRMAISGRRSWLDYSYEDSEWGVTMAELIKDSLVADGFTVQTQGRPGFGLGNYYLVIGWQEKDNDGKTSTESAC